jgi:arabinosyltransferase C
VLVVWWLIGSGTSDDGYILTMARNEAESGYIGNIFRWFNTPEAPFGWFYELYARWVRVSTMTPWLRLPALLMGIASWLLISREALPRLGQAVRRSPAAGWAAAGAFLAFWLPYDNGLRPESVVVLWTLLSMVLVERAIAAKRLLPAGLALFAAAFAVDATPTGLMALAPLLAASRPLLALLRERGHQFGWLTTLAPLTAAGTIVLLAVFGNQTMRSVLDSTQIRTAIGPSETWYQERDRYEFLFSMTRDGSLERRFPVLLIGLCLLTCLVVLLRRGRIPGAATGPSMRLIGTTILSFGVLVLTPTKWTHHFGAFAALGGSMAALTALATSTSVLRSRRNRALFTAGLLLVTAVAFTGPNAWFYTADWGSPWTNMAPVLHGHMVSSLIPGLAVLALLVAGVEHLRGPQPPRVVTSRRRLRFAAAPLALICAVMVLAEVANFGKVIVKQGPAYSLGKDNVAQLTGSSCGVSDYTYVETNPLADVLTPSGSPTLNGFRANGFPQGSTKNPAQRIWLPMFGSGPDAVPAWGNSGAGASAELRTGWYPLPARAHADNALLVVDVAGPLGNGNTLTAEFGRRTGSGFQVIADKSLSDPPGAPGWREAKLALAGSVAQADAVRLTATASGAAGANNWLGVSAPRVPALVGMTKLIGNSPTFVEWPSAQGYPCLRPFGTSDGISELPAYWYSTGEDIRLAGQQWSGPAFGGPLG